MGTVPLGGKKLHVMPSSKKHWGDVSSSFLTKDIIMIFKECFSFLLIKYYNLGFTLK